MRIQFEVDHIKGNLNIVIIHYKGEIEILHQCNVIESKYDRV